MSVGEDKRAMSKGQLTSRQLATQIGVSQSAVSRAFTPGSSISDELRDRVLKSARDFGYQPNAIASMLTTKKTKIVGIIVSDVRNPFYPVFIERLTQGLQQVGLQSLLFNITPGASIEDQLIAVRTYDVDAVVVLGATVLTDKDLLWAVEGRRAVLFNRLSDEKINSVCCDGVAGTQAVMEHFQSIGRQRIGYVAGLLTSGIALERYRAFTTQLDQFGMQLAGTASYDEHSYQAGWKSALDLLPEKPDAIFFASDILALGGMDALRKEAGLRIPDDIAVCGFDDIAMASWPTYSLTTYRQPLDAIVDSAIEILVSDKEMSPARISLPGELIVRASTRGE